MQELSYIYNLAEGDKVVVNDWKGCNIFCGCGKHGKRPHFIKSGVIYTIKKVHHFGGGCPPVLLSIEELPQTQHKDWWKGALPAQWFDKIQVV